MKTLRCYVDGSWSPKGNDPEYSGWGVLFEDGTALSGTVLHEGTRQIAGECEAVLEACEYALGNHADRLVIFYDYQGLPEWANGSWKAKTEITKRYQIMFTRLQGSVGFSRQVGDSIESMEVRFIKVYASANKADALATAAIGIKSVH